MSAARGQHRLSWKDWRLVLLFPVLFGLAGCAGPGPDRDFRLAAHRAPDRAAWVSKVPPVSEFKACGELAPLAAVLRFWGAPARPGSLAEPGADPAVLPDSEEAMVRAVWRHGLWAYPCSASDERLKQWLRAGVPVLVRLETDSPREAPPIDALVVGFDDARELRLVDRLSGGRAAQPSADFLRRWRAADHRALVIRPPDDARLELGAEERVFRARYFEAAGQTAPAIRDYEAALESGVHSPAMLVSLGNLYRGQERAGEAEALYRRAIRDDPRQARAYNNLAYLLAEQNRDVEEAVRLARQALVLDPANPLFMDTLGYALMEQERYDEAARVLERAWGRSRWYPTHTQLEIGVRLALAHFRGGQEHLAAEVLRDLLSMDPALVLPDELQPLASPGR